MRLGIDIDGVLTDTLKFKWKYGMDYFGTSLNDIRKDTYEIRDIFNVSHEKEVQFVREYFFEYYCSNNYLRPFASQVLNNLHNQNNEIVIITGRTEEDITTFDLCTSMRAITENWLKSCNIPYDELYLEISNKPAKAIETKVDCYIEDLPYFLDKFLKCEYKSCICFDDVYNRYEPYASMLRIKSWTELYSIIKRLEGDI